MLQIGSASLVESVLQGDETDSQPKTTNNRAYVHIAPSDDYLLSEPSADGQQFFPSFSSLFSPPPLGHSRPPFFQESAYSQRPSYKPQDSFGFGSSSFRDFSYTHAVAETEHNTNVLGSGNFGVLRGGTYYAGDRDEILNDDIYGSYYHGNNGHGRPSYFHGNPLPQYRHGGDFFANFRDFADISSPTKSSYSEYVVVYVNPNSSAHDNDKQSDKQVQLRPKNIIEQLTALDATQATTPEKKVSKAKLKLVQTKKQEVRKENKKNLKSLPTLPKDTYEPLLAVS